LATSITLGPGVEVTAFANSVATAATVTGGADHANVALTLSGVTGAKTIILGNGNNIVVTGDAADVISVGSGTNKITPAGGADTINLASVHTNVNTIVATTASSVATTAANVTNGVNTVVDNLDTFTYGVTDLVDIITNFKSTDRLDVTTAGATYNGLNGTTAATPLNANSHYFLQGTYTGGIFTVNSTATAATANVALLVVADATTGTLDSQAGVIILIGNVAADLSSATFI
jgi:hypothetical protein